MKYLSIFSPLLQAPVGSLMHMLTSDDFDPAFDNLREVKGTHEDLKKIEDNYYCGLCHML